MDPIRLPDASRYLWLFFSFRGRLGRKLYFLAGLLLLVVQFGLLFRFMAVPEGTTESGVWALMFMVAAGVSVVSNIALAAKRIQDFDKPGFIAVVYIVAGFIMFLALCFIPGSDGPNRYGAASDGT